MARMELIARSITVRTKEWTTPRLYCSPVGETVMENFLHGRRNRPYELLEQQLQPVVEKALKIRGTEWTGFGKITWSQKAGCSCPCSPGFLLEEAQDFPCEVWVEYEVVDSDTEEGARKCKNVPDRVDVHGDMDTLAAVAQFMQFAGSSVRKSHADANAACAAGRHGYCPGGHE